MQLEGEATARAIRLAYFVNTPLYVVHVMCVDAMEEIAKARKSGSMLSYTLALLSLCKSAWVSMLLCLLSTNLPNIR